MKKFTKLILASGLIAGSIDLATASLDRFSYETKDGLMTESVLVCSPAAFDAQLPGSYIPLVKLPKATPGITPVQELCLFTKDGRVAPAYTRLGANSYFISDINSRLIQNMTDYRFDSVESNFVAPLNAPYVVIPDLKDGVGITIKSTHNGLLRVGLMYVTVDSLISRRGSNNTRTITKLDDFLENFPTTNGSEPTVKLSAETLTSLLARVYEVLIRNGFINISGDYDRRTYTRHLNAQKVETIMPYTHLNTTADSIHVLARRVAAMRRDKQGCDQIDRYLAALVVSAKAGFKSPYWPQDPFLRPRAVITSLVTGDISTADQLSDIIYATSLDPTRVAHEIQSVTNDIKLRDTKDVRALELAKLMAFLDYRKKTAVSLRTQELKALWDFAVKIRDKFPVQISKL